MLTHPKPVLTFTPPGILPDFFHLSLNAFREPPRGTVAAIDKALEPIAAARVIMHLNRQLRREGVTLPNLLRKSVVLILHAADPDGDAVPLQLRFHSERHLKIDVALP